MTEVNKISEQISPFKYLMNLWVNSPEISGQIRGRTESHSGVHLYYIQPLYNHELQEWPKGSWVNAEHLSEWQG